MPIDANLLVFPQAYQPSASVSRRRDHRVAGAVLESVVQRLSPQADAIFVRQPLIDPHCPATSDLDLLIFGQVDGLLPERLRLPGSPATAPLIDLVWLPLDTLESPKTFAANGLIPHRLLSSRMVYDRTGYATKQCEAMRQQLYQPEIQRERITGFLDLGFLTTREVGITWDFPSLALFWLHVAHVACLAAMCDGLRGFCPNIYTRPLDYLRQLEQRSNLQLERTFIQALHLDVDPRPLRAPLQRIHAVVCKRFPEPRWPEAMKNSTRYEYRYFLAQDELDWRLSVAQELTARGDSVAATYYLRFWAYVLARIPMVHQRAHEGRGASYIWPKQAVRPALEALCPEILGDLEQILGGHPRVTIK
jgi:hypothetical protein